MNVISFEYFFLDKKKFKINNTTLKTITGTII